MKLTKKILAFLLMVSMILSLALVGQATSFTDVPENHPRYQAITELAGRGIINGYGADNGTFEFKPDQAVTRAEMAKLLATMFSISNSTTGVNPFIDIDECWAKDYIIAAKDMGIINGYPDGTYLPDNQVSWQEAVKLIICALNWGEAALQTYPNPVLNMGEEAGEAYAELAADWAYSYKMMAQKLGLSQGALMIATDPAPRGIIAQLFYNALSIKRAVAVTDKSGNTSWIEDPNKGSSVEEQINYKTMSNVRIICNPTTNLEADTLTIKDGYIRVIDYAGNKFDMSVDGNTSIYNLIGRRVDVSYEEKDNDYIIKSVRDLSNVTEFGLDKIKTVSENSIEYFVDDNFFKTSKVNFTSADVIYNERPLADPTIFDELLTEATTLDEGALNYFGDVTVAEKNGQAIITIKAYKSYYMSKAVSSTNSETDGYKVILDGRGDENPLILHVKDDINNEIIKKSSLTDKGTVQTTVSIGTKSIVTFAESHPESIGNHYVEYFVTSAKKSGAVEEISSAKAPYKGKIKIGSTTYLVKNDALWGRLGETSIGSNISYMTDPSNEIVYIDSVSNGNERFAFFESYVSGDTNEHDSATFKFYDPETAATFQVVISDPEDISGVLLNGKAEGHLFWVRIKNNKVASGDIIDVDKDFFDVLEGKKEESEILKESKSEADEKLINIRVITGSKAEKTTSGYKIDSESITVTTANGKSFYLPDTSKSSVSYEKSTMTTNLTYTSDANKTKAYVIQRQGATKAIVLHDKYKGLLASSPVCVINESTGSGKVEDISVKKYSYYNFKTGALSANDLVIDSSVASELNLQKGDIITYYSNSETSGIHIDKLETVYVLLRASEVAENKGADLAAFLDSKDKNAAEDYLNGFRKYTISSTNIMGSQYYNYILSIPVWYDYDINQIALSRNKTATDTYLPGDDDLKTKLSGIFDEGGLWNKTSILEKMPEMTQKTVPSSVKVFVYDDDASEEGKLVSKAGATSDEIKAVLSEMQTLEANNVTNENEILSAASECSLVYSYFSNISEGMVVLYIIK